MLFRSHKKKNYLKLHLFSSIVLAITFQTANINAAERIDLYNQGKTALASGNCISAIKNLYAFYILNQTDFEKDPDFTANYLAKIERCELALSQAIASTSKIAPEKPIKSGSSLSGSGGIKLRGIGFFD